MNAIIDRRSLLRAGGAMLVAFNLGLRPRDAAAWAEKPVATDEVAALRTWLAWGLWIRSCSIRSSIGAKRARPIWP